MGGLALRSGVVQRHGKRLHQQGGTKAFAGFALGAEGRRGSLTSHLLSRPVSCSRDQMLWIRPACSGCTCVFPHMHWCFSMNVSYTTPEPETYLSVSSALGHVTGWPPQSSEELIELSPAHPSHPPTHPPRFSPPEVFSSITACPASLLLKPHLTALDTPLVFISAHYAPSTGPSWHILLSPLLSQPLCAVPTPHSPLMR